MEGNSTSHRRRRTCTVLGMGGALLILSGCLGEDEQLHQQMKSLRAELRAAEEKVTEAEERIRELQSKESSTPVTPAAGSVDSSELSAAREKIAALEKQLAEAKAAPPSKAPVQTAESYKELAKHLQTELMQKVSELSDLLQAQIPSADVQDVTVKRIRPPEEIATAFSSAITFTLLDRNRQPVPLSFPVQAGLDGAWKIPSVEDVKRVYADVSQGIPQSAPASPAQPAPGSPSGVATNPPPAAPSGGGAGFVKQSDGSILVNWDDSAPAARPSAPAASTTASTPPPSTPAQPAAAPAPAPAPATPSTPNIPAPVMPVQQDIIVRFE